MIDKAFISIHNIIILFIIVPKLDEYFLNYFSDLNRILFLSFLYHPNFRYISKESITDPNNLFQFIALFFYPDL